MSVQAMAWVLEHERTTTGTDRLVLLSLANHVSQERIDGPWECWPGIDRIMAEAGVSRRQTVKDALARLKAKGLITVEVQAAPDSRIRDDRRPNLYTIHHDGGTLAVSPLAEGDGGSDGGARGLDSRSDGGSDAASTGARETSPEPVLDPGGEPEEQPDQLFGADEQATNVAQLSDAAAFEEFWQAVPAARRIGKGDARKAWATAVRKASAATIIAGMVRYAEETQGRDPQYLKTPGPWLRAERWTDEPGANRDHRTSRPAGPRGPIGEHRGPAGAVTDL